ncbi:MAG: hypothetical protein A2X12_05775 [Bacteroidetes bacterium GWE2_29_8]|nr:MAG: hypothetical protein A2X12_05775 [Bacteroidetes bacterium GWE2_29_8]OFY18958.1 MAG: hypothetical protein A2X02_04125 [Bacteroidetes bacterium GWF2_29_10]
MEKNKVLILGAGLVVKPMIEYLKDLNFQITIASKNSHVISSLLTNYKNGKILEWETSDESTLDNLIKENDIVASLLPYVYHTLVAKYCIKHKKNMITASYVKPEMEALDSQAREAGIVILNELGLDPGIDHMSAMKIIDEEHAKGNEIEEFYSFCGALPAPDSIDNPFNYKFSWSPKGVVMAGNNDAVYLKDEKEMVVETANLFKDPLKINIKTLGTLEVYPNRDSISYIDIYKIPEVKTIMRGTFRYENWCEIIDGFKRLNMIGYDNHDMSNKSYIDMLYDLNNISRGNDIKTDIIKHLDLNNNNKLIEAMNWLGMFSGKKIERNEASMFDVTSDYMIEKMMLNDSDRDMVVMQHTFVIKKSNNEREVIKSSMIDFGDLKTDTAIARTVALPAAIAINKVLSGEITEKGVQLPVIRSIYIPIMKDLEKLGIRMVEEYGIHIENKF